VHAALQYIALRYRAPKPRSPDDLVGELVERMVERDVGRVPVLDEAGRLVGLVSRKDLLAVHARQRALETEREAAPPIFAARAKAKTPGAANA
jgi:CBS domain containing-hemolysin-like protein